jgi:hypothetical protein
MSARTPPYMWKPAARAAARRAADGFLLMAK